MPCTIQLRHDQTFGLRHKYSTEKVIVFAPEWVQLGLTMLAAKIAGAKFQVLSATSKGNEVVDELVISDNFNNQSLIVLQRVARNEQCNVDGSLNFSLYSDFDKHVYAYSLRDLVRQTVIVGVDETSQYGGYPRGAPIKTQNKKRVYVCDLAALQFQEQENTGRLVLVHSTKVQYGILDQIIYENVVGEAPKSFKEIQDVLDRNSTFDEEQFKRYHERYIPHPGFRTRRPKPVYFDTVAYKAFVKNDVVLAGLAIVETVKMYHPEDKILFKFQKYGTTYFSGSFTDILNQYILEGVMDGLEVLFRKSECIAQVIRAIELPGFVLDQKYKQRVQTFSESYDVHINFETIDPMLNPGMPDLVIATTNRGDNHVVFGNEMQHGSLDASIAENVESKGHIFSANINQLMQAKYLSYQLVTNENESVCASLEPSNGPVCNKDTHSQQLCDSEAKL